jgi:hypothetical protein
MGIGDIRDHLYVVHFGSDLLTKEHKTPQELLSCHQSWNQSLQDLQSVV